MNTPNTTTKENTMAHKNILDIRVQDLTAEDALRFVNAKLLEAARGDNTATLTRSELVRLSDALINTIHPDNPFEEA